MASIQYLGHVHVRQGKEQKITDRYGGNPVPLLFMPIQFPCCSRAQGKIQSQHDVSSASAFSPAKSLVSTKQPN